MCNNYYWPDPWSPKLIDPIYDLYIWSASSYLLSKDVSKQNL
jgi:hypothetical protein